MASPQEIDDAVWWAVDLFLRSDRITMAELQQAWASDDGRRRREMLRAHAPDTLKATHQVLMARFETLKALAA